jgi:two-component system sensor histidine kinase KdpD
LNSISEMSRASLRSPASGLIVAAVAVAATTGAIFALREVVPVVSTSVLYLLAVMLVSSYWGLWLGLLTSLASALAFNFFHIPPTGRLTIAESQNWVALLVYFVVAVVVSTFADSARARAAEAETRRREADVAADLARVLLGGGDESLALAGERVGEVAGLRGVRLSTSWEAGDDKLAAIPLVAGGNRVGTLLVPRGAPPAAVERVRERLVPALSALLEARARRAALEEQVVETRALRRSDVLKTALLRAVSHDLRSPLTAIGAAAGSVDSDTLTAEQRRELKDVIATETDRLSRLVDDLLDLSRLESGNVDTNPEPSSVEEVLDAASAGSRNGSLDIDLDADLPLVDGDPVQIERALVNLLDNAARYSDGAPVRIRAHAHGRRVLLRISDSGPGIAEPDLERIFEPFYRGSESRGTGSGLGLAIARGFVEANGGRLRVESLPGQGTTFVVELRSVTDE